MKISEVEWDKANRKHVRERGWPADKPIPKFRSRAAEERFWNSHEFEVLSSADGWEEIVGPRSPRSPNARRALVRKR